ncbi:MAG: dicarboxylate/amino acid:cation symporter, partial [Treponema sp.]|nr:dicarboxylate/amino acid:cation symporter [Treponema sp.]
MTKKLKIGLVGKLLIAIVLGILLGLWAPVWFNRIIITASTLFSSFLRFVIPLLILAFVTMGIADLSQGAGKLLGITAGMSYASSLIWGSLAFIAAYSLFPRFMSAGVLSSIGDPETGMLSPYFRIPLSPVMDVTAAVVLAFTLGLCLSIMRNETKALYEPISGFSKIISQVLKTVIIPLLPLYICGT